MILASGNVVHNQQELQWRQQQLAYGWGERFDDAMVEQLAEEPGDILRVLDHPDYRLAVLTRDHFIPVLYLAGLAPAENNKLETLVRGHTMGSISMTCFGLGAEMDRGRTPPARRDCRKACRRIRRICRTRPSSQIPVKRYRLNVRVSKTHAFRGDNTHSDPST